MSNRKRRTAPRVLGALAAAGALGLAAPGTVASACPEHDKGSDSGGQSSSGATGAGGANSAAGANSAGSANRTGANAQKANNTTQKANNTTSKSPAAGGQDSTTACSDNPGRPDSGPCGTDLAENTLTD
jgi:hypothetical protein